MKIIVIIATIILTCTMFAPCIAESYDLNSVYPRTALVTCLDWDTDTVIITDWAGLEWAFEGIEDWQEGDLVSLLMWDAGTPDSIFDDHILKAYYGGWLGLE